MKKRSALTIAGSDPCGGAGLQADLRTFASIGVHGLSIPAVLTAQNTAGVESIQEIPSGFFAVQLEVLLRDIQPDAVKTGMLYTEEIVDITAEAIRKYALQNFVIDPVTVSSSGVALLKAGVADRIMNVLFPLATVITPNIKEAGQFTGIEITSVEQMREAALKLIDFGPKYVIITGGHLKDSAEDLLYDGKEFYTVNNELLPGEFHGTGCIFSSALAALLARGEGICDAFRLAKEYVWQAMNSAQALGRGMKILG